MPRIVADLSTCQGYANCVVAAPELFDLDDEGKVEVLTARVTDGRAAEAAEAVGVCPVGALRMEES